MKMRDLFEPEKGAYELSFIQRDGTVLEKTVQARSEQEARSQAAFLAYVQCSASWTCQLAGEVLL
ncbi:hypothetical protein [Leisingera sp. M523]|uniref:hypothetical protein n=1 Tax=Leisingera sp. M523 TaxID=2867013 RepID=UPI0021A5CB06|nr:hypothetical protein [Leisingera sp. M523]UWQ30230.1 hypothetical protein K3557_06755 [Leisingera sp. M523]